MATATTLLSVDEREVVRCVYPDCLLRQYWTSNSLCRRCHRPLRVEEPERPGPVAVDSISVEPSAEAGLKVAGQVRDIRRARHLSQRQLAGRMNVPRTYISSSLFIAPNSGAFASARVYNRYACARSSFR